MGKIADNIYSFVSRYKYLIVIVVGVLVVGFLDDNSYLRKIEYEFEIADLKEQIKSYNDKYEADAKKLKDLERDPKLIVRIAREKYFMKAPDEDIFVLSDDEQPTKDINDEEATD